MHIRNIHTDKPTGVVGFLPMEGGDAVSGGGGEAARPSVPVVTQIEERGTGVQEELEDVDDLGSDVEILEAPQANPANNMIQSLDVSKFEHLFPKLSPMSKVSDRDKNYNIDERQEAEENYNIALNTQNPLQERYNAAAAMHAYSDTLQSDAYFSIATNFSIGINELNDQYNIENNIFIPFRAAENIHYARDKALALYTIAINPAVPPKFRYGAVMEIYTDDYEREYEAQKMDAFEKIARDIRVETVYRVWALRRLKNNNGMHDEALALLTQSIAERWDCRSNTEENWRLFENLYRLEAGETEWIPDEYLQEKSTPAICAIHLSIIEIIINKTNLDLGFRLRVIHEKLKNHHQQLQALDNIQEGKRIELSLRPNEIKSARNLYVK